MKKGKNEHARRVEMDKKKSCRTERISFSNQENIFEKHSFIIEEKTKHVLFCHFNEWFHGSKLPHALNYQLKKYLAK